MGKFVELSLVKNTVAGGKQDHVVMEEHTDGINYWLRRGKPGVTVGKNKVRSTLHPLGEWDETLQTFLDRGYVIIPGRTAPAEKRRVQIFSHTGEEGTFLPEKDPSADALIRMLREVSRQIVSETFECTISVDMLSPEQIKQSWVVLDALAAEYKNLSVQKFNSGLCEYFSIVPRLMHSVNEHLASGKDHYGNRLDREGLNAQMAEKLLAERERLQALVDLQDDQKAMKEGPLKTATESFNLECRAATPDEMSYIRRLMKDEGERLVRAWKVVNNNTRKLFDEFCKQENLTEGHGIDHLFHGSRTENFWSIIKNGLTINPVNVQLCGKAYGLGTYFAPNAVKSMGYTDRHGSKWAGGTQDTGFMGIFKVATGKRYDGSHGCDTTLTWEGLQKLCPGAHCTWAESRWSGFLMDEVIVYQDCQSTIEYLVEFC